LPEKTYLAAGEASQRLGISTSQLTNLVPHLLHLAFYVSREVTSTRQTRLFPTTYISALAQYMREHNVRATLATVTAFAQTDVARKVIEDAQSSLERAISSRAEHTPAQIATMFNIGRATVMGWERAGVFHPQRRPHEPKRRRSDGVQERHFIPADEVREGAIWVVP
jgi:hypothetical protein